MSKKRKMDAEGQLDPPGDDQPAEPAKPDAKPVYAQVRVISPSVAERLASPVQRKLRAQREAAKARRAAELKARPVGTVPQTNDYLQWQGKKARDPAGKALGNVANVFLDKTTGEPTWVSVQNMSSGRLFLPYGGVLVLRGEPVFPLTIDLAKGAPKVGNDLRLSPEDEAQLSSYYDAHGPEEVTSDGPAD